MLGHWTAEDERQWNIAGEAIDALYTTWIEMAVAAATQDPTILSVLPPQVDVAAWFQTHLEQHRAAFCGSPLDPQVREASRQIGFSHIQSQVLPSWYISLYNLIFPAYHALESRTAGPRLPALEVVRRRWLADMDTTLDTYTVAVTTQVAALSELAFTDSLTGLLNRRGFWQRIRQDVDRGVKQAAFVLMDLDHFKAVNDQDGHPEGDRVLQRMAVLEHALARSSDALGRLGGDEFAWWAVSMTDHDALQHRLQDFSNALYRDRGVTFSAGLAWYPDDGDHVEPLYQKADAALYRAKQAGRQCWTMADRPPVYPL